MALQTFEQIVAELSEQFDGVEEGNMMRSPGLKYNGKVFCFFHEESMTFKLGNPDRLAELNITEYGPLSPFKTKPPLKGWYVIGAEYADHWPILAQYALDQMR